MRRYRFTAPFAASMLLLPAAGQGQTLFVDDFEDGNDDGWTHWTLPPDATWARWEVIDDGTGNHVYHLFSEGPIEWGDQVGGLLARSEIDPRFWNGYWGATVDRDTEFTNIWLEMRGNLDTLQAYAFGCTDDAVLIIRVDVNNGNRPLAVRMLDDLDWSRKYTIEAGLIGFDLEVRVWPADEARPDQPLTWITDDMRAYPSGANCLSIEGGLDIDPVPVSVTFDDVYFVPWCWADLTGDAALDSTDFIAFLNAFVAGDPLADHNLDGVIDSQDFTAFLNAFVAGC